MLAGHDGVFEGQACQLVGGTKNMAAFLHHHGAGLGVWDMVLCSCMVLRPLAATLALVCVHIICCPKEAAISSAHVDVGQARTVQCVVAAEECQCVYARLYNHDHGRVAFICAIVVVPWLLQSHICAL